LLAGKLPQLEAALAGLETLDPQSLAARIAKAGDRWPGARPTAEPANSAFDPPPLPPSYHLLAADGSQIHPDRHAGALFYLINIGSLHLVAGSGAAPQTHTRPALFHEPADLYDEFGGLIPNELIDGRRDAAELGELARLAQATAGEPSLALLDNGLILWLVLQVRDQPKRAVDEILRRYLGHLRELRDLGAAVAGVIDRPRHANVASLAHLGELPLESVDDASLKASPYLGLTDRALFDRQLAHGQRSAVFIHGSPVNRDFDKAGHQVHFYYLKTAGDTVLRVEIPVWVANNPRLLGLTQAAILADSAATDGFPYALARAHELAVIGQAERTQLESMLADALLRHGLPARPSTKAAAKRWLTGRRRHRV
jgi:hypothetical protein